MQTSTITCGLAVFMLACTPSLPPSPRWTTTDERAIRAVDSTYVAAWLRDDTSAVMSTLAANAVLMPAGQQPLTTPNEIRGFWWPADGSHTHIVTFARRIDEIDGQGDVAWVRGTDTLTYAYDKGSTHSLSASRSMTLALWRRQPDGTWRISRMMWGTRAP